MRTALALLEKGKKTQTNCAIPERKTYGVTVDKHTKNNILIYF